MYCGDETGAFIGDIGSHAARFGYGGEDCPKVVVPSAVYSRACNENGSSSSIASQYVRRSKYSAPVSLMRIPPDECFSVGDENGQEVGFMPIYGSPNSSYHSGSNAGDVRIQDIDAWASLWEYSYQALCVRGKGKHTVGHKYHLDERELQKEPLRLLSQSETISSQSKERPIDHPLLAADSTSRIIPTRTQDKQRALMLETLFESLSAPAAYLASSSMLSSFAFGRQTSLVIDIGHLGSRVTPLVDGYCLNNGSVESGRGGRWLGNIQKGVLEGVWDFNESAVNKIWNGWGNGGGGVPPCHDGVIPRYLLHPNFPERKNRPENKLQMLKQSCFHSWAIHDLMYEMMTSSHIRPLESSEEESSPFCGYGSQYGDGGESIVIGNVVEIDGDEKEDDDDDEVGSCYVLPDGTRVDLTQSQAGKDLCRLPELLIAPTLPSFIQPPTNDKNSFSGNMLPIHQLIHKSLTQILDVNLRKELSSNIILTGGASLFPNLDKRLSTELGQVLPSSYKYKVIASKNSVENRYSSWIGGSILSSLGSFQQLWLSKKEYDECGALLGLQRFKN